MNVARKAAFAPGFKAAGKHSKTRARLRSGPCLFSPWRNWILPIAGYAALCTFYKWWRHAKCLGLEIASGSWRAFDELRPGYAWGVSNHEWRSAQSAPQGERLEI